MTSSDFTPGLNHAIQGMARILFVFDVGQSIDLDGLRRDRAACSRAELTPLPVVAAGRRFPPDFSQTPPLRMQMPCEPEPSASAESLPCVELSLYEFGAVCVTFSVPIDGEVQELIRLSAALQSHPAMLARARQVVSRLCDSVRAHIRAGNISDAYEDYIIFELRLPQGCDTAAGWIRSRAPLISQVLRSEVAELSTQESEDVLSRQMSYQPQDVCIIDWHAAVVIDPNPSEVAAILEFANVELLEMRHLDGLLDRSLDRAYQVADRPSGFAWLNMLRAGADLNEIARMQIDHAALFEGVNNALKLVGDQYLARLYHAAGARFHLPEWDESILRKLGTLESIYSKLSDRAAARRAEVLEIIIIALIAFEILMALVGRR